MCSKYHCTHRESTAAVATVRQWGQRLWWQHHHWSCSSFEEEKTIKVPHPDTLTPSAVRPDTLTPSAIQPWLTYPYHCTTHPDTLTPSAALALYTGLTDTVKFIHDFIILSLPLAFYTLSPSRTVRDLVSFGLQLWCLTTQLTREWGLSDLIIKLLKTNLGGII